jgi:hypothetical protein
LPQVTPSVTPKPIISDQVIKKHKLTENYIVLDTEPSAESKTLIEELKLPRFNNFYDVIQNMDHKVGQSEPAFIKQLRPFLLAAEAVVAKSSGRRGNGKKNGKKIKIGEYCSTFSILDNWKIGLNNFIPSMQTYKMTSEVLSLPFFTTSTTLPTFVSKYFTFSELQDSGSLAAVFDQYRITCIEWWCYPRQVEESSTVNHGDWVSVIDYDDEAVFTSQGDALGYTTATTTAGTQGHFHRFIPHVAVASYSGAFTSYDNVIAPWIDVASSNVRHYGIKVAFSQTSSTYQYDSCHRIHYELRSVR